MKITVAKSSYNEEIDNITWMEVKLETKDYTDNVSVSDMSEEPEDANFNRGLSDFQDIPDMLRAAYNAGRNGEELEVVEKTEE